MATPVHDPLDDLLACPVCGWEVAVHAGDGVECLTCCYRVPRSLAGDIPRQQRRRIAQGLILRRLRARGGIRVSDLAAIVRAELGDDRESAFADAWWGLLATRAIVREGGTVREAIGRP